MRQSYDSAGRLALVIDQRGNSTSYAYDAVGQQISTTDPLGGVVQQQYDALGNVIATTDALGHVTHYQYDADNRLVRTTFADGTSSQTVYDALGRKIKTIDAAGNATTYAYDALGRLTSVTDALGNTTHYEYDSQGNKVAQVDANGHRTTFAYDPHGRLVTTTYPLGDSESYAYDAGGRVTTYTNGNGQMLQYAYDTGGRLSQVLLPDGTAQSYTYTTDGLRQTVTDARGVTSYTYDPVTRRLTEVTEPDGRYIRYAYDAAGNQTLMAHAMVNGAPEDVTQFSYDALNRLSGVTDNSGGVTTYSYDAAGNRTGLSMPDGTTTTYAYDPLNRLTSEASGKADGTRLASFIYALDAVGNRISETDANGSMITYTYDPLNRVTAEQHVDGSGTPTGSAAYSYDAVGNLLARSGSLGIGTVTYAYNADNQLVSANSISYAYDGAGNRVSATDGTQVTHYAYDARGRLAGYQPPAGGATAYTYDVDGMLQSVSGPAGNINYLVDPNSTTGYAQVVQQSDALGTILDTYTYGRDLLEETAGRPTSYVHEDGLGSVRLLTDPAGTATDAYSYDVYGNLLAHIGTPANPYLFAGEPLDSVSGLFYMRARYYDPATGSFLSRDPLSGRNDDPISQQKYLYASDNPVNLVDPSGRQAASGADGEWSFIDQVRALLGVQMSNEYGEWLWTQPVAVQNLLAADSGTWATVNARWLLTLVLDGVNEDRYNVFFLQFNRNTVQRVYQAILKAANSHIDFAVMGRVAVLLAGPDATAGIPFGTKGTLEKWGPLFIMLAPAWWPLNEVGGYQTKAGVLIHELSHIVFSTTDVYGCDALYLTPYRAAHNADNYEFYAEDTLVDQKHTLCGGSL
jgi:RHS repeat-associated protein